MSYPLLKYTIDNPTAYGSSSGDNFGFAVAMSDTHIIVGARLEDDASGTSSGKAYIFDVTTGALIHTLNNPNPYGTGVNDYFGVSVAISGNYAIVGAHWEDIATKGSNGKAYIFDVITGALLYTLNNPDPLTAEFGIPVSISGEYALVSTRYSDDGGFTASGKCYIYNVTTGELINTLLNPNAYGTPANDWFGYATAISGNRIIVSALGEDDTPSNEANGKAYIFDVTTGALIHTLNDPNIHPNKDAGGDQFGISVGISSKYAIVGAHYEDTLVASNSGKAYIFDVVTGYLLHVLDNTNGYGAPDGDSFAFSTAISDKFAIVGAYNDRSIDGSTSGSVHIYSSVTGAHIATFLDPNFYGVRTGDAFSQAVSTSGPFMAAGAYGERSAQGSASGVVHVFQLEDISVGGKIVNIYLNIDGTIKEVTAYTNVNDSIKQMIGYIPNS